MTTARSEQSRRVDYSESTRNALVDSAVTLFTDNGYAATSLDAVARGARVTKGALYHHFSGKQALFEAAFDAVESAVSARLVQVVTGPGGAWERAMEGVRGYVNVCLEPSYQRIVIHEGPVVMGWDRWREAEDRFSFGLVRATLEALIEAGEIEALPVETTARVLFGALSTGATIIAGAPDPERAGAEVLLTIERVLVGMRAAGPR
ncbi:TetR/AcrR family transcriptional regulator [Actinokineospora pegani]|uniref:TetR/AcrR family transcriptional regulator n=1 Tax=Actinokineospora pegani TaxID=2654637 RepID=UPI0012E9E69F|nr:TetR/AcrR family transcriptional regulator [Actinokineospora pegani]